MNKVVSDHETIKEIGNWKKEAKPWYWTDLVTKVSDEFVPPSVITDDIMPQSGAKTKWCSIHKKRCKRTGISISD
jgi:hypothetical protein